MRQGIDLLISSLWIPIFVAIIVWSFGADQDEARSVKIQQVEVPCLPGGALPSLTLNHSGIPLISWVDREADGTAVLKFAKWQGNEWSPPREIVRGKTWFVNWADYPTMAVLDDGTLAVHWLDKISSDTYAYGIKISLSRDGGETWSDPVIPHSDRSPSEHGFLSLKSVGERFHLAWLDGRETLKGKPMTLRSRFLSADGTMSDEILLDESVCDCCPVDAVVGKDSVVTFYRDRDHMEVRDIAWIEQGASDGKPVSSSLVHDDQWIQPGCPVNGPAVAGDSGQWVAVWYTESESMTVKDRGAVFLRSMDTAEGRYGKVHRIDAGNPLGRVEVCQGTDDRFLICWMEEMDGKAEVSVRPWKLGSLTENRWVVAETSAGRKRGFPQIVQIPGTQQALVAYTVFDEGNLSRVETAWLNWGENQP